MSERVFVDPVIHSERLRTLRTGLLVGASGLAFGLIVGLSRVKGWPLQAQLMAGSAVAAVMGLWYYIQERSRRAFQDFCWMKVDAAGVRSSLPAGEVFLRWDEIDEVWVNFRAARGRGTDVMIRSRRGSVRAALRWVERGGPLPEPVLSSGGSQLQWPDGRTTPVDPEHSPLVSALRERLPAEKIKLGAMFAP
mgnify:CR=1 FL=1